MKPFGKPSEIRHGCMCCSTRTEHRTKAKANLRKLIKEESENVVLFNNTVPKSERHNYCSVCGDYENPACVECC